MKKIITSIAVLLTAATTLNPLYSQTQIGGDIDGKASVDFSGFSVSLSSDGSRLAIGAVNGNARVYEWDGGSWVQVGEDISGGKISSSWSVSLSSDGSRLAIGMPFEDYYTGYVLIYEWNGASWVQLGKGIVGKEENEWSGNSVSLSPDGSRLAIGAPYYNDTGQVRIYEWDGSKWSQVGEDVNGEAALSWSGSSVSLSGDGGRVAIGAPYNGGNGAWAGHVRIYDWDGEDWVQVGGDIDGEAGDLSGFSISLTADGSKIAIGADSNDGNGNKAGRVRIHEWNGSSWLQVGEDIKGEAAGDLSGSSVSLSSDGSRVAVGAPENDGNGDKAGHVRIYEWIGGSWTKIGEDIDGEAAEDLSGSAVSLSSDGSRIAIGAPDNSENGNLVGHVRIFDLSNVTNLGIVEKNEIEIFPNPTTGKIELIGVYSGTIKIMDSFGRNILKVEKPESKMDISDLPNGIYYIHILSGNQWITKKIIKQ